MSFKTRTSSDDFARMTELPSSLRISSPSLLSTQGSSISIPASPSASLNRCWKQPPWQWRQHRPLVTMQWLPPRVPTSPPWVPWSLDTENEQSLKGTSLPWPHDFNDGFTATPAGNLPVVDSCPYDPGILSPPPTVNTSSNNHKSKISIYPNLMTLLRKASIRDEQIVGHEFFTLAAYIIVIPILSDGRFFDFGQSKSNEYINSRSLSHVR